MDQQKKKYATDTIIIASIEVNNSIKRIVSMMKLLSIEERKEINEFLNKDTGAIKIKDEFKQLKEDLNTYC